MIDSPSLCCGCQIDYVTRTWDDGVADASRTAEILVNGCYLPHFISLQRHTHTHKLYSVNCVNLSLSHFFFYSSSILIWLFMVGQLVLQFWETGKLNNEISTLWILSSDVCEEIRFKFIILLESVNVLLSSWHWIIKICNWSINLETHFPLICIIQWRRTWMSIFKHQTATSNFY